MTVSKPLAHYTICSVVCLSIDLCGCNFLYNCFVQKLLFKGICSGDLEGIQINSAAQKRCSLHLFWHFQAKGINVDLETLRKDYDTQKSGGKGNMQFDAFKMDEEIDVVGLDDR